MEKGIIKQIEEEFSSKRLENYILNVSSSTKPNTRSKRSAVKNNNEEKAAKQQKLTEEYVSDLRYFDNEEVLEETSTPHVYHEVQNVSTSDRPDKIHGSIKSGEAGTVPETKAIPQKTQEQNQGTPKENTKNENIEVNAGNSVQEIEDSDTELEDDEIDYMAQRLPTDHFFINYPDLQTRYKKKPKSLKNLMEIVREKEERDKNKWKNETLHQSKQAKRKWLMDMAAGVAEIGSPLYWKLVEAADDEKKFMEILSNAPQARIEEHNKKLTKEYEKRINLAKSIKFEYQDDIGRFCLRINDHQIKNIQLSDQISYVLGFEVGKPLFADDLALYACDLRGGIHFYIVSFSI